MTQPLDEFIKVRRIERFFQACKTVAVFYRPGCERHQVQVVIAEYGDGSRLQVPDEAQGFQRLGTTIDQVASKPKRIFGRVEAHGIKQAAQRIVAALHIANCVNSHQFASAVSPKTVMGTNAGRLVPRA